MQIIRAEKNVSIQGCVSDEVLSFSQLIKRKIADEHSLIEWIANYIYIFFSTYFNVTNNISPSQGIMVANELVKHMDLSPEDIICFVKSIKENDGGRYGASFNRIDPPTIMGWFSIYLNDRIDAVEAYKAKIKSEFVSGSGERTSRTMPLSEIPVFNKESNQWNRKKL